ncbi:MBL fold metallo-hydrolase, partial [Streptomyces sp. SR27]|nr:MBL fold metallo-hydrolase [Streptomyces sp. SR27]
MDLRLVPLAVAAWAAAACALGAAGWWTLGGVAVCLVVAVGLLVPGVARRFGGGEARRGVSEMDSGAPSGGGRVAGGARRWSGSPGWRLRATAC